MTLRRSCGIVAVVRIWEIRLGRKCAKTKCRLICETNMESPSLSLTKRSNVHRRAATRCLPQSPALMNIRDKTMQVSYRRFRVRRSLVSQPSSGTCDGPNQFALQKAVVTVSKVQSLRECTKVFDPGQVSVGQHHPWSQERNREDWRFQRIRVNAQNWCHKLWTSMTVPCRQSTHWIVGFRPISSCRLPTISQIFLSMSHGIQATPTWTNHGLYSNWMNISLVQDLSTMEQQT